MDKSEQEEIIFPGDPGFEYFDDEERELIESYERGEWRPIKNQEAAKDYFQEFARRTLERLEREKDIAKTSQDAAD